MSTSARSGVNWQTVAAVVLVLLLGGFLGFRVLKRLDSMEQEMNQQMALLRGQVEESAAKVQEAETASHSALDRATAAEEDARQAALGKIQAEQARAAADQEAAQATQEAQQARQVADQATEDARRARAETEQIRQRREAEIERLRQALGKIADTQRTALGLVMTLGSDSIHFDFDKATLRPDDRELLSRIAGVLLTAYGFRLRVYGHTDDIGTDEYNQTLSERRAQSVRDYLVQAGIAPDVISTKGYGKTSPRVRGTTSAARARNRRVEIAIIDSVIDYQGEVSQRTP